MHCERVSSVCLCVCVVHAWVGELSQRSEDEGMFLSCLCVLAQKPCLRI